MRIIITGASGFVGRNLSAYLEKQGAEVENLSLRNSWNLNADADAVIHLAGKAHDTANTSAEEEYFKINTDLTIKLFEDFLNTDIPDFFYFSSVKATADVVEGVLDENHDSNPQTPYGKSKLKAEEYLLKQTLPSGKRLFIVRPCMIHGPGNKGNLNLLYQVVKKGLPWPLASFENLRSFLSVDNLCYLIDGMLKDTGVPSGIYNFADDAALSTNDLIRVIASSSERKARLLKIPASVISGVAAMGDVLKLPLNSERLKKLTENYVVSNTKIKSQLRIEELPTSVEQGLEITIRSFGNK